MTRTLPFLLVFLLSPPTLAVDPIKLPAISADGTQVAFPEYFSDSMGMDSRVKFVKTCTEEGLTLHITCTECRQRDSDEIDKRLKDGGFKSLKEYKFPKKRKSSKFSQEGLTIKMKRAKNVYRFTAFKDGKIVARAKYKLETGIEYISAAILIQEPVLCLYLQLEIENGTSWAAVPLKQASLPQ
jgi:hypothetical protein